MTERSPDFLRTNARTNEGVKHILKVQPATSFEYRFESSAGIRRVIHLERGSLESTGGQSAEVLAFRAGVSPIESPTRGGFYTSPDSIPLAEEAHILVEDIVAGDSIICRSYGSWNGLPVTVTLYRENVGRILQQQINDADEHTFGLP